MDGSPEADEQPVDNVFEVKVPEEEKEIHDTSVRIKIKRDGDEKDNKYRLTSINDKLNEHKKLLSQSNSTGKIFKIHVSQSSKMKFNNQPKEKE